jgi:tetratricopeptide (TPR) repeat protein
MQAPRVALLRLAPLNAQETRDLICSHLGVDAVADSLLDLVHRKADGNPLFCHQLADVIDDALDKSQQDRARCLTQGDLMLERIEIPNTLHGAITSRIDRLEPSTQLALKVASVIGRHFSFRALQNNFPIAQGRLRIRDYLRSGLQANLIEVEIPEPSVTYVFEHVFTRDVAYQMLLFDQRRQLHHAVAEWLEQTGSDEGMASAEVLAHHWRHAGRPDKAIEYLDRAGNAALRNGAYAEAAEFLRDALSLAESIEPSLPTDRLARWQRQLGESLLGLGQLANGKARLESSLELLQYPSPTTHSRLLLNLLGQLATQLQRRMRAALRPINSLARTGDSSVSREAVRAYERLAETYYLMNDRERLLHALLVTVNLAERIGPSPELARAYANNCFAAGLAGIHPLARSYSRDAQRIAAAAQDLSATAWVQQACGIYQLGLGQLDTALDCFSKAATVYRQIGDWTHWGETVAAAAQAQYHRGSVAIGTAQWQELHDVSIHRGDVLQQAWALNGLSESELRRGTPGHAQRALRFLEQARTLYQANVDRISLFGSIGLTAWAHLRQADDAAARQAADAGSQLATELGAPTGYYSLNGYLPIAHTYLTLYERTGGRDRTLAVLTRQACRRLDRYARTFPLGRAYADWQKGIAKWLAGNQTLAIRVWRRALASAEQRNLPHAAALVHFEIGRRVAKQPAAHVHAADHLRQARQLFLQLDAQYERAQTEQLLSQIGNLFADEA